ncbi:MAG: hypothetical protein AB7I24_08200 [Candidatus Nanopelagicales bacterium]
MALTPEGRALTNAYRSQQQTLVRGVQARVVELWPLLDLRRLDATQDAWVQVVTDLVAAGRALSAQQAEPYLALYRAAEGATGPAPVLQQQPAPLDAIATSIRVTGPIAVKAGISQGLQLGAAGDNALVQVLGAVARHTLDGGRGQIVAGVTADRQALGWARVTSGRPCAFCAMLASRGPVYRSQASADFQPHDHCSCTPEAIYHREAAWSDQALRYRALYQQAVREGDRGGPNGKYNAFRAALSAAEGYPA